MSDYTPVGARTHVSQGVRGGLIADADGALTDGSAIFAAVDADATRPIPVVARRRLGETGLVVFPFALGTARLAAVDDVTAERVLHRFAVRGGTLYDVVDEDGSGRSQELLGAWLADGRLSNALIALTASPGYDGGRASGSHRVVRAVDNALGRLRVGRVDLLMLDFSDPAFTIEQQLSAADELVAAGVVGHVGVRGATGDQLLEARVLASNGMPRLVAVRPDWDITVKTSCGGDMRMVAAAQGLAVLPDATAASLALASPSLPQKVLAGWGRGAKLSQAVNARVVKPERDRAADALASRGREHRIGVALDRVSADLDVAPATTQLAWLLAKRGVVAPVVQVTRPEQVDLLMDAAAVRLTRAHMLELDRAVEPAK